MFYDPMYMIFVMLPTMALSFWASMRVKSAFKKWSQVANSRNMTGADVARLILDRSGCSHVRVEPVAGNLTDHYDPSSKILRLSDSTFSSTSIAAAGVAAHEAGHAIQDKVHYPMLKFRSSIVGLASTGSRFGWILITVGSFLMYFSRNSSLGYYAILAGVIFFSVAVVFQLVTVPVEINASSRARKILREIQFAGPQETKGVDEVLSAAAWTYVAAAIGAVMQLLYFLFRLGILGGSDD